MMASPIFRRSPRLSRLFRHVVEQSLRGEDYRVKEYSIAVEVFGKPETFDPRIDSVVRVAARQLRAKLEHYYGTEGRLDPILIRFRPGDYTPRIHVRLLDSNTADCPATDVLIVDGDRRGAHSVAECLDPAVCRITGVTNDSGRALSLIERSHPAVVVVGVSVCGGLTGCELMRAVRRDHSAGIVAVISAASTAALISDVVACDPDAIVFKPLRTSDVETAVRVAVIRAALRETDDFAGHCMAAPAMAGILPAA
jgi:CheY-like chemotaxis protein